MIVQHLVKNITGCDIVPAGMQHTAVGDLQEVIEGRGDHGDLGDHGHRGQHVGDHGYLGDHGDCGEKKG